MRSGGRPVMSCPAKVTLPPDGVKSGQQVEQGCFSRPVGAYERVDRALGDLQVHRADGAESLELLGQALHDQDGARLCHDASDAQGMQRRLPMWGRR